MPSDRTFSSARDLIDDPCFDVPPYSTWDVATHGPEPYPAWVITDHNALDTDLGILKTGKEADVHLVRRALPLENVRQAEPDTYGSLLRRSLPGGAETLMAAKRYRTAEHRMFHRDASYAEGRRVRKSRESRAMARRTEFGRDLLAAQWAGAEFAALSVLCQAQAPVPYPVQLYGTELMLEFIGDDDGTAAPRLAQVRPDRTELADLFEQCIAAMRSLARAGYAHGDLSAYNLLVHEGTLVLIDLPQVVDLAANPQGPDYLRRDCENICAWFARRGLETAEFEHLFGDLMAEAVGAW